MKPSSLTHGDLNEIEVKLKQMRIKRQSRLSTFVTEQSKFLDQRGGENYRKSWESANELENVKPSLYKTVVTDQSYAASRMKKIGESVEKFEVVTSDHIGRKSLDHPIQGQSVLLLRKLSLFTLKS